MNVYEKTNSLTKSLVFPLIFLLIIWAIFYYDHKYSFDLYALGINPRKFSGLIGILFSPLLHGDFNHIISNTFPLLILATMLFYYYKDIAYKTFFIIYFSEGILVWLFGSLFFTRNSHLDSYHIGASGIIYGLAGFLFFSGLIRKNLTLYGTSLLVIFLYGSVVWGIFPLQFQRAIHYITYEQNISWEGHLFGFLTGLTLAFIFRKQGIQKPVYSWEKNNDDDIDDANPYWMVDENGNPINQETHLNNDGDMDIYKNTSDNPYTINYTYLPNKKEDGGDQVDKDIRN